MEKIRVEVRARIKKTFNKIGLAFQIAIVVLGFSFVILWLTGVVTVVKGHGSSMEPTLSDGDMYLQVKTKPENIKRGDIVGAVLPDGTIVTKRVIGLPGEYICIGYSSIWANHDWVAEPYLEWPGWNDFGDFDASFDLGPDEFYLMGDNRAETWCGIVTGEQILGRVIRK